MLRERVCLSCLEENKERGNGPVTSPTEGGSGGASPRHSHVPPSPPKARAKQFSLVMAARILLTSRGGRAIVAKQISAPSSSTAFNRRWRHLSSTASEPATKKHPQSFVQSDIDLELGELETELPPGYHQRQGIRLGSDTHDGDGRASYWRPPWRNPRAEILTAEDFANRPRVNFSESFLTLKDAMAVLTWMGQDDKDGMYGLYVDMMTTIAGRNKKNQTADVKNSDWGVLSAHTSHEYVVRVVAQKYNVTTSRAAGVIQLQHNEEQLKKDPDFEVNHALQARMDEKMREYIRDVYQSYGEMDPLQFVEDPIVSTGRLSREDTGSDIMVTASELADVDAIMKQTRMRELDEARVRIANHIYVEDVDDRTCKVKVDQEVRKLMKIKEQLNGLYDSEVKEEGGSDEDGGATESSADTPTSVKSASKSESALLKLKKIQTQVPKIPKGASPYPDNNRGYNETPGTRRPRWKFAAQFINTHALSNPPGSNRRGKGVAARSKAKRHGRNVEGNTIIEENGKLRVASVSELESTSWKHVRNESEFMFRGVKDAWLRRELEGEVGGWGYQQEVLKVVELPPPKLMEINADAESSGSVEDEVIAEGEEGNETDDQK